MSLTAAQCRAARALIGWSQDQLTNASKVAKATIANFELGNRDPYPRTLDDLQEALESAGVEFTNGGQPGVRLSRAGMLHLVAGRSQLEGVLELIGRGPYWKIDRIRVGLECKNQHGEVMGRVLAGNSEEPRPIFQPDIGELHFPDRVTPNELRLWVNEMARVDQLRGKAARAFEPPSSE